MNSVTIFWLQLLLSLGVCALVVAWFVWPYLTKLSGNSALILLLLVHVPRYVGMTLLVRGMIDPKLPRVFLSSAAYGDLIAAALALASIFALRSNWRVAIPLVWVNDRSTAWRVSSILFSLDLWSWQTASSWRPLRATAQTQMACQANSRRLITRSALRLDSS
jgi:hypothetical protein